MIIREFVTSRDGLKLLRFYSSVAASDLPLGPPVNTLAEDVAPNAIIHSCETFRRYSS